jgi:general stress protein YciG
VRPAGASADPAAGSVAGRGGGSGVGGPIINTAADPQELQQIQPASAVGGAGR